MVVDEFLEVAPAQLGLLLQGQSALNRKILAAGQPPEHVHEHLDEVVLPVAGGLPNLHSTLCLAVLLYDFVVAFALFFKGLVGIAQSRLDFTDITGLSFKVLLAHPNETGSFPSVPSRVILLRLVVTHRLF